MRWNSVILLSMVGCLLISGCESKYNPQKDNTNKELTNIQSVDVYDDSAVSVSVSDYDMTPAKVYSFSSGEEVESLPDDDIIEIATHNYISADFVPEFADSIDFYGRELQEREAKDYTGASFTVGERVEPCILRIDDESAMGDVSEPVSDDLFQKIVEEDIQSLVISNNGSMDEAEIIFCGETDAYAEYSISFSAKQSINDTEYDYPMLSRRCFYRNIFDVPSSDRMVRLYYGEMTAEAIQSAMDFAAATESGLCLYREVRTEEDSYVYVYYSMHISYGDYGVNDTVFLEKRELLFGKESHEIELVNTVIKELELL